MPSALSNKTVIIEPHHDLFLLKKVMFQLRTWRTVMNIKLDKALKGTWSRRIWGQLNGIVPVPSIPSRRYNVCLWHMSKLGHPVIKPSSDFLFLYQEVLETELPWLTEIVRAKRPQRLPTVLTVSEVHAVLARLDGTIGLMVRLLYGTGMRLMECVRLRIKDLDRSADKHQDTLVPFQ